MQFLFSCSIFNYFQWLFLLCFQTHCTNFCYSTHRRVFGLPAVQLLLLHNKLPQSLGFKATAVIFLSPKVSVVRNSGWSDLGSLMWAAGGAWGMELEQLGAAGHLSAFMYSHSLSLWSLHGRVEASSKHGNFRAVRFLVWRLKPSRASVPSLESYRAPLLTYSVGYNNHRVFLILRGGNIDLASQWETSKGWETLLEPCLENTIYQTCSCVCSPW